MPENVTIGKIDKAPEQHFREKVENSGRPYDQAKLDEYITKQEQFISIRDRLFDRVNLPEQAQRQSLRGQYNNLIDEMNSLKNQIFLD